MGMIKEGKQEIDMHFCKAKDKQFSSECNCAQLVADQCGEQYTQLTTSQ